jgi:hypothetical protein
MQDRLFDNPYAESTPIKNVVFDRIMPTLSSDGWKVLCVAIRQTWGWRGNGSLDRQSERVLMTILQLMEKTGIKEQDAVERAIEECLNARYLVRRQADRDADLAETVYVLNVEFEPSAPVADVEPVADGTPLGPEAERAFQALLDFGREMEVDPDLALAREAVTRSDADAVLAWIEMGREMTNLEMRARFQMVVQRLLDQVPPLPLAMLEPDTEPYSASLTETAEPKDQAGSDDSEAHELWQATLDGLKSQMRKSQFKWLKPTQGIELKDGVLTVAAPNQRVKEWMETGAFATNIKDTFDELVTDPVELMFVVAE